MKGAPDRERAREIFKKMAPTYDQMESRVTALLGRIGIQPLRNSVIAHLHLRPGEVVVDVGCGTGASFQLLEEAIGSDGRLIGVELTPEMLQKARERVASNGWDNVTLIESAAEEAELPVRADAALFCLGHDIMSSSRALANILRQIRPGGRVAAGGLKWAPWWAVPVNIIVRAIACSSITTEEGFDRPWRHLVAQVPHLRVRTLPWGGSYVAWGGLPAGGFKPSIPPEVTRQWST